MSRYDHGNQRVRHQASPYFVPSQNSSPHISNDQINPSFPGQNAGNQIQTDEIATLNLRIAELIKSNSDMALRYDTLAKSNAEMSIRFDEMQSRVNRVGSGSSSSQLNTTIPKNFQMARIQLLLVIIIIFSSDYLDRFTRTHAVFSMWKK